MDAVAATTTDGLLGGDSGEVFVQGAEGSVVQGPLSGSTEGAKPGGTDCIRSMTQESSSLGGVGTRCGKVAVVQFRGSEIDQDQYTLPTRDWTRLLKCRDEPLACTGVVTSPEKNATARGTELRGTGVTKRGRNHTAADLADHGVCTVKGLPCGSVLTAVCMDGGLDRG